MGLKYPLDKKTYDDLIKNNASGEGGFYPIGLNRVWHCGVHLYPKDAPIKPIKDGKLVAFRMNKELVKGISGNFVLLKHEEVIKGVKIDFFSLYSNLALRKDYLPDDKNEVKLSGGKNYPKFIFKEKFNVQEELVVKNIKQKDTGVKFAKNDIVYLENGKDFHDEMTYLKLDEDFHGKNKFIDIACYKDKDKQVTTKIYGSNLLAIPKNPATIVNPFAQSKLKGPFIYFVNSGTTVYDYKYYKKIYGKNHPQPWQVKVQIGLPVYGSEYADPYRSGYPKKIKIAGFLPKSCIVHIDEQDRKRIKELYEKYAGDYKKFNYKNNRNKLWCRIDVKKMDEERNGVPGHIIDRSKGYNTYWIYAGYDVIGYNNENTTIQVAIPGKKKISPTGYVCVNDKNIDKLIVLDKEIEIAADDVVGYGCTDFYNRNKFFHYELILKDNNFLKAIDKNTKDEEYFAFNSDTMFYDKVIPEKSREVYFSQTEFEVVKNGISTASKKIKPKTMCLWIRYGKKGDYSNSLLKKVNSRQYRWLTEKENLIKNGEEEKEVEQESGGTFIKGYVDFNKQRIYFWIDATYDIGKHKNLDVLAENGIFRLFKFDVAIERNIEIINTFGGWVESKKTVPDISTKIPGQTFVAEQDILGLYKDDPLNPQNISFKERGKVLSQETRMLKAEIPLVKDGEGDSYYGIDLPEGKGVGWIEKNTADDLVKHLPKWNEFFKTIDDKDIVINDSEISDLFTKLKEIDSINYGITGIWEREFKKAIKDSSHSEYKKVIGLRHTVVSRPYEWSESRKTNNLKDELTREHKSEEIAKNEIEKSKDLMWFDAVSKSKLYKDFLPQKSKVYSIHPLKIVDFASEFNDSSFASKINYFKSLIKGRSGAEWQDEGVNIIALRIDLLDKFLTNQQIANDLWIVVVDNKMKAIFQANTKPGENSGTSGGTACIVPGSYKFAFIPKDSKLRDTRHVGFFQPLHNIPCYRDKSGNGFIDADEKTIYEGLGIQLHAMGYIYGKTRMTKNINGFSHGCQGPYGRFYFNENEKLTDYEDKLNQSDKKINKIYKLGVFNDFIRIVRPNVEAYDINKIGNSKLLIYHLFEKNQIDDLKFDYETYLNTLYKENAKSWS